MSTKREVPRSSESENRRIVPGTGGAVPEQEVRRILSHLVSPNELPTTVRFHLYHVRGVGNDKYTGGEDKDVVLYGPEFTYLCDVGYPTIPVIALPFSISGLGDPRFPDFDDCEVYSATGFELHHILHPAIPGNLLIGVLPGTSEGTVRDGLGSFATAVEHLIGDMYLARTRPFHEPHTATKIEEQLDFVKYAALDHRTRLVDFLPGWFVDRVC